MNIDQLFSKKKARIIKIVGDKEDQSIKELERLEKLYTRNVNFDSVIIIDFGNNLKRF